MAAKTLTVNPDANASVTPINEGVLKDSLGFELTPGMRVTTSKGEKATVLRLDKRSRRAVISFEIAEGEAARNDTMRAAHLLKVRRNKGKIMMAKKAVKAGAKAK